MAASRCPISTCAAGAFRCGRRSPASAATRRPRSPSRPTSTGRAGGDYFNTNYPQPTYLSSRALRPACRDVGLCRVRLSRRAPSTRSRSGRCRSGSNCSPRDLRRTGRTLSGRFGRQPPLPDWVYSGAIIGLKDGANSFARLEAMRDGRRQGVRPVVRGLGRLRQTSFGARLFWDWKANESRYPDLRRRIAELRRRRHPLPRLCQSLSLRRRHHCLPRPTARGLSRRRCMPEQPRWSISASSTAAWSTSPMPDAAAWFAERIIGVNMLDFGLSGWMADFGEYLPIDVHLANGVDAQADAQSRGRRCGPRSMPARSPAAARPARPCSSCAAGFTGVQTHCPLLWAGDQSVDFSRHDGLVTVICGALSSGLLGNAYHHSDIGGYTSLFGNVRTPELIDALGRNGGVHAGDAHAMKATGRATMCRLDHDPEVLPHFARMTRDLCPSRALSEVVVGGGRTPRPAGAASAVPASRDRPAGPTPSRTAISTAAISWWRRCGRPAKPHVSSTCRTAKPGGMSGAMRPMREGSRSRLPRRWGSHRYSFGRAQPMRRCLAGCESCEGAGIEAELTGSTVGTPALAVTFPSLGSPFGPGLWSARA